ncbi:MAG TPA: barstar family protein [Verrucomicrobiae bacterium]|nr:barstar family protein [Verrucomicrobiae bacterium]
MREFIVDLSSAESFEAFVSAFNDGFCRLVSGEWHGRSWDAFHDYLSWPEDEQYQLTFRGWADCRGLDSKARQMLQEIFNDNPHVHVIFA